MTFHGWGGIKKKRGRRVQGKKVYVQNLQNRKRKKSFQTGKKKSADGYKLPYERETMSTLTILFCNLIIPPFVCGESVPESMSMA